MPTKTSRPPWAIKLKAFDIDALLSASQDAYGTGVTDLARADPPGPVRGKSRLVNVHFRDLAAYGGSAHLALRWEAIGPGGPSLPGRSLRRLVEGAPAQPLYAETLAPRLDFGWSDLRAWRDGRYKYIRAPRPELYDLVADPVELVRGDAGTDHPLQLLQHLGHDDLHED